MEKEDKRGIGLYGFLLICAIIVILLAGGFFGDFGYKGIVSNRQTDMSQSIKGTTINVESSTDIETPYTQRFHVFETVYNGRHYTCFYGEGGNSQVSISCTRDIQTVN